MVTAYLATHTTLPTKFNSNLTPRPVDSFLVLHHNCRGGTLQLVLRYPEPLIMSTRPQAPSKFFRPRTTVFFLYKSIRLVK